MSRHYCKGGWTFQSLRRSIKSSVSNKHSSRKQNRGGRGGFKHQFWLHIWIFILKAGLVAVLAWILHVMERSNRANMIKCTSNSASLGPSKEFLDVLTAFITHRYWYHARMISIGPVKTSSCFAHRAKNKFVAGRLFVILRSIFVRIAQRIIPCKEHFILCARFNKWKIIA